MSAAEIARWTGDRVEGEAKSAPRSGVTEIAVERDRQIRSLLYSEKWDRQHTDGELVECAREILTNTFPRPTLRSAWPRERAEHVLEKYLHDPIKRLAVTGALIAAEIDRLKAAGVKGGCGAPAGEAKEREEKKEPAQGEDVVRTSLRLQVESLKRELAAAKGKIEQERLLVAELVQERGAAKAEAKKYLEAYHGAKVAAENMEAECTRLRETIGRNNDLVAEVRKIFATANVDLHRNDSTPDQARQIVGAYLDLRQQVAEQDTVTEGCCGCGPQGLMISVSDPRLDQLAKDVEQLRRMVVGI